MTSHELSAIQELAQIIGIAKADADGVQIGAEPAQGYRPGQSIRQRDAEQRADDAADEGQYEAGRQVGPWGGDRRHGRQGGAAQGGAQ